MKKYLDFRGLHVRIGLGAVLAGWALAGSVAGASEPVASTPSLGRIITFVSPYCPYCRKFEDEVAGVYPKTELGKQLPMVMVDTFDPPGDFAEQARYIAFTPCMIVQNAQGGEVARIRGYRGDEFFWGELEAIVRTMRASVASSRRD